MVGNFQAEIWQDVHCLLQLNLRSHRDLLHRDLLITATVIHQPNKDKKEKVGSDSIYIPKPVAMGTNIPHGYPTEITAKRLFALLFGLPIKILLFTYTSFYNKCYQFTQLVVAAQTVRLMGKSSHYELT